ncbi:hypothetical protein BH18THE1_BH18THE1_12090 [soil metagenome]
MDKKFINITDGHAGSLVADDHNMGIKLFDSKAFLMHE